MSKEEKMLEGVEMEEVTIETEGTVSGLVENYVAQLTKNDNTRFSKSDFQSLVYAVLSDPDYKVKKYVIRNGKALCSATSVNADMKKFLDKFLKHAGVTNAAERNSIIDSFTYGAFDINWITDAVDEAMWLYSESGKSIKVFRDKLRQVALKKMVRSGKHAGKIGYKKTFTDKMHLWSEESESEEE